MKKCTRIAPAKINLGLDIIGRRADGYHLLETVFQTISIYDRITIKLTNTPGISIECTNPNVPCNEKNIAWKAAAQFCEAARITCGIKILLEKHIPMQAGMGGGSTDGAAVLSALQELTGNPLSQEQLCQIAVKLGADVPFFLCGGTAYAAGIGEELEPLPPLHAKYLVIAKGTQGVSTAEAYGKIDALQTSTHPPVQQLRQALLQQKPLADVASLCGNLFEKAIQLEDVSHIQKTMLTNGALCSVMTGSGAAVFGIFQTPESAQRVCEILQKQVPFAIICETV